MSEGAHRALFMLAEAHGDALEEIERALFRIEDNHGELPQEGRKLQRSIGRFLAQYRPPGLTDKWDSEGPEDAR